MRLALLTPDWTPNGGIATYVRGVSAALAAAGHDVLVLHAEASNGTAPPGVQLGRMRGFSYRVSGPSAEAAVADALEQLFAFRPDVVHLHGVHNIPLERRILSEFAAVKTLHVYDFCPAGTRYHHLTDEPCRHGVGLACVARQAYLRCTLSKRPRIWWSQYANAAAMNVHNQSYSRIIVAAEYVRQEAVRAGYDADRVVVLPYFTAVPAAPPAPRPRHVLFVGRLVREKGLDLLFDALAAVPGEWTCTIVGDGPWNARIRRDAASRAFGARVTFAGWLDGQPLADAYAAASVVAVPSRWPEPFGIVGLEAMAYGRPAVAFRVGGIPEWLDDGVTGHAVEPGDTRAFSARLASLFDDPAAASEMGARGRTRVARAFSADAHLARLLPIYKDLRVGL